MLSAIIYNLTHNKYRQLNSGIIGEMKSQSILDKLPTSYTVLSNVDIEFEGKRSELDNLVISDKGVIIIETKNYNGEITGKEEDDEWLQTKVSSSNNTYTNNIRNPLKQAKRQVYILSQILKNDNVKCWVDYYVFINNKKCYVESGKVINNEEDLLRTILSAGKEKSVSEEDINKIKKILVKYSKLR